jgi:hypothetical protein
VTLRGLFPDRTRFKVGRELIAWVMRRNKMPSRRDLVVRGIISHGSVDSYFDSVSRAIGDILRLYVQ